MKRKNTNTHYCVVCRARSAGAGLTTSDGVHICFDCAELIHNVMDQWHEDHLVHCDCGCCSTFPHIPQAEYMF